MSTELHRDLEILKQKLEDRLGDLLSVRVCLSTLREAQIEISRNYRNFTVWGPDLTVENILIVTIYCPAGVAPQTSVSFRPAESWCNYERGALSCSAETKPSAS